MKQMGQMFTHQEAARKTQPCALNDSDINAQFSQMLRVRRKLLFKSRREVAETINLQKARE